MQGVIVTVFGWLSMLVCLCIAVLTIICGIGILKNVNLPKRSYLRHLIWICAIQGITLVFNGFQFKYNQGAEVTAYWQMEYGDKETLIGLEFDNLNFGFTIRYAESEYCAIRFNLLSIFLSLLFYYYSKNRINLKKTSRVLLE